MKPVIGLLLGVAIGGACRWFDIPVPAPPKLIGALLVVAMTAGYLLVDRALGGPAGTVELAASRDPARRPR